VDCIIENDKKRKYIAFLPESTFMEFGSKIKVVVEKYV
jgi:hypothetical protein